jgi:PKD repeat protein
LSKQAIDGIIRKQTIGKAYINAINNVDINHLWGKRFNTSYDSLEKTKYAFSLFGLSSVEIDPPAYEKQNKVSYGTPVYNTDTREWVVNITFDVPKPVEVSDSDETVTEIYFTDIDKYMFDEDGYPALSLIYFDYDLPTGANFSSLSLVNATVYTVYNISQPNVKPKPKREEIKSEEKANLSDIMENRTSVPSGTEAHNFTLNTTITINTTTEVYDEGFEKVELYTGELFPDVLFVNGTEYDSHTNTDKVFGSVTAWQVDGTINKTAVYDKIVLKLTYTAPVGVEETHVVDEKNLTVYAIIVSTDGKTHLVKPSLEIETIGGIRYKEVSAENTTVGETPQIVTFEVSDIELPGYVGRITVTEGGKCVAETSFTVMKPIASFSYTPEKPVVNQTIIFNASNSTDPDGFITNYTWDLGDNETGCGKVTTHAYSSTGNYTVTLTVTDDEGAVNYTSRIVTVREPQPTVTISTDKIVYNPGNTMVTSISFENPTDSAVDTYFVWYLYLPDYDYWIPVMTTSFTLPSGFDECYDSTITIGNWGSRKFNASWRVVLLNTTPPYEIIRQDTAE